MEQKDYEKWINSNDIQHPTHWDGDKLVDDDGNMYNPWILEWCKMSDAKAENFNNLDVWHTEMGVYTDMVDACNARLLFMQDHPDRYYRIRQSNGWHNNAPCKDCE